MSTRQLRLSNTEQIRKRIHELAGKKINIVLRDRTVFLATVAKADDRNLHVINMRLKKVAIPLDRVSEIYFDTKE